MLAAGGQLRHLLAGGRGHTGAGSPLLDQILGQATAVLASAA